MVSSRSTQGTPAPTRAHDPLLTVRQLAELEGLKEREVRRLIQSHGLPHVCLHTSARGPRGVKIRLSAYRAWLESRKQQ